MLPEYIKAAMQPVSSNMRIIIKILRSNPVVLVGHGSSSAAEVRRVLFHNRIRLYYPSFDLYHHSLGTPVRGQFLMYIRALRATLNKTDRSFNSVSLSIS